MKNYWFAPDVAFRKEKFLNEAEQKADEILNAVCEKFGVDKDNVKSGSQKDVYSIPRSVWRVLIDEKTKCNYKENARITNAANHTSVIHAKRVVKDLTFINLEFAEKMAILRSVL